MSDVEFSVSGPVAVLTINRPASMNAISSGVVNDLYDHWERFESDEDLKVAILTGAGEKAFCAGMDLKEMRQKDHRGPGGRRLPILGDNVKVTKPVIAAVNGVALAGGWLLAQMCDLCVAADTARFGITEVKVGRGVPWAAALAGMLPERIIMELLLVGDMITAQRAYEIGFVNRVVAGDRLMDEAMEMAMKIAGNAPLTVRASKELVYLSQEMGRSASMQAAMHVFDKVYKSEDAKEGPRAFAEKRKPVWTGR